MDISNLARAGVNTIGSLAVIGMTANIANNIVKSTKTNKKGYKLKF